MSDTETIRVETDDAILALFIAALNWRRTWIREEGGRRLCYGPTSIREAEAEQAKLLDVAAKVAEMALDGNPIGVRQCPGGCADDCLRCGSGIWELLCDDCRFYAAQDAEPSERSR